jgi:hypothetical protein
MSLPKSHLRPLERHLKGHEARLAILLAARDSVGREIERRNARDYDQELDDFPKDDPIGRLNDELALIEREISAHEDILAVGRDTRLFVALAELADNPALAREAAEDPRAFAEERGIALPKDFSLTLSVGEAEEISLHATYYHELSPFVVIWDAATGFSVPELTSQGSGSPIS